MFSQRFSMEVFITQHARQRMAERSIDDALLLDMLETGRARYKDDTHLWVFKAYEQRHDNLLCAAVVIENRLIVKTVMHHFEVI